MRPFVPRLPRPTFRPAPFSFTPGGWLWLLEYEMRIKWRGLTSRWSPTTLMNVFVAIFVLLHGVAWLVLQRVNLDFAHLPPAAFLGATLILLLVFTLMLSSAISQSVTVLFTRGDLDLLLASPLPMRTVLTVRALGVAANTIILLAVLVLPFANVAAVLGKPRLLALYPLLAAMAFWATSLGLAATFALTRLLGPRRARTVAQILGALVGAAFFLLSQVPNLLGAGERKALAADVVGYLHAHGPLATDSLLLAPGRAAVGDLLPLAIIVLSAAVAFGLTIMLTRRAIAVGSGMAVNKRRRSGRQPIARARFRTSLAATLLFKEWRLIRRDPLLISQILLQLIYLVPAFLMVFQTAGQGHIAAHTILKWIGPMLVFLAASLAESLSWIIVSAEDAPALLMTSPIRPGHFKVFKVLAALIPVWLLMAPIVGFIGWQDPWRGTALAAVLVGATVSIGMLAIWAPSPGSRQNFRRRRRQPDMMGKILILITLLGWSAIAYALPLLAWWGILALPFSLAGPLIAWWRGRQLNVQAGVLTCGCFGLGM